MESSARPRFSTAISAQFWQAGAMRKLIFVAILTAAVTATGVVWWSVGDSGAEQATTGDTALEGDACTSCAARHQRLTKPKDGTVDQ